MASSTPAGLIGETMRGRVEVGKRADLAVFTQQFGTQLTIVDGRIVFRA
jgi:N-acetylglucosamine-6-phosphate deacetylase